MLTSVTTAYLPRNLRPEIRRSPSIPSGTVFQRPFSTGETELAGFDDAAADVRFAAQAAASGDARAAQPDACRSDAASIRRACRRSCGRPTTRTTTACCSTCSIGAKARRAGRCCTAGLTDPIFVWDTTSVPDGTYFVKVSASDAPSNSPGDALVGELESVSFDIDNTAPTIELRPATRAGARATITFTVRDEQSPVQRVEYSLDASRWRLAYPKDGIADSRREEFEVRLDEIESARSVIIRATDAMNNVATRVADIPR